MTSRSFTPLTQADRVSPLWKRLRAELIAEREQLRADLERNQPEATTASIRTRLMFVREILALETDPATQARRPMAALQLDE
jgi:hypothetical protein